MGCLFAALSICFLTPLYVAAWQCSDLFAKDRLAKVIDAKALKLQNPHGEIANLPASNFYAETPFRELVDVILGRRADQQARIDEALTQEHARNGNTFKMKNTETGAYDVEFAPKVTGAVLPLEKDFYQQQVAATAPVMRSLRRLLQGIYTSGELIARYQAARENPRLRQELVAALAQHLNINYLPKSEQARLIEIIANSIYLEPAMMDPVMARYPFLPVVGFDAAIDTLQRVNAIFFEFNSGTPSGLSNNVQLLEILRKRDPKLYASFKDLMIEDRTFENLKAVIDSGAREFTGAKEGMSVMIGPGAFNGAHPDVAAISLFSGMPLVYASDLYVAGDGWLHLNTGVASKHPRVTGIYSRAEESSLLSSEADGIGFVDPRFKDNAEFGRSIGVELRNGVAYDFIFQGSSRVDVVRDAQGRPKVLQHFLGVLGRDPAQPNTSPERNLAWLIRNRRVYLSNLGGRVVDDKRIFEIVHRYLAPRELDGRRHDESEHPPTPIAGPPRTLRDSELGEFKENPERFVTKVPDESGGAGVFLGPIRSAEERAAMVREVFADRERAKNEHREPRLTVQQFVTSAVMNVPIQQGAGWRWGTVVPDVRLFVFMDAKGNVSGGGSANLLRVAKHLSPSTNTSQGAGYGIAVILQPHSRAVKDPDESLLPKQKSLNIPVPASGRILLASFFEWFREVEALAKAGEVNALRSPTNENPYNIGNHNPHMLWSPVQVLMQAHREVIAIFGVEYSWLMSDLRDFQNGRKSLSQLRASLRGFRVSLIAGKHFQYDDAAILIADGLNEPANIKKTDGLE